MFDDKVIVVLVMELRQGETLPSIDALVRQKLGGKGTDAVPPPVGAAEPVESARANTTAAEREVTSLALADVKTRRKPQVFVSYSHEDREQEQKLYDRIFATLKGLELYDHVEKVWFDRKLAPGAPFHADIKSHLESSQIAVLILGTFFFGSSYIHDTELAAIKKRKMEGLCQIIPLQATIRNVLDKYLSELEPFPKDRVLWPEVKPGQLAEDLTELLKQIRALAEGNNENATGTSA